MSLYEYVGGSPLCYLDSSGRGVDQIIKERGKKRVKEGAEDRRRKKDRIKEHAETLDDIKYNITNETFRNPPCAELLIEKYDLIEKKVEYESHKIWGCSEIRGKFSLLLVVAKIVLDEYVRKKTPIVSECLEGKKCCNKIQYDGSYKVTLKAVLEIANGQGEHVCTVKATIVAAVTAKGWVGSCLED
jgi:hypothetical protein